MLNQVKFVGSRKIMNKALTLNRDFHISFETVCFDTSHVIEIFMYPLRLCVLILLTFDCSVSVTFNTQAATLSLSLEHSPLNL